jgi:ubiquinone/menaquinone biosynthesis C-methylase UbiE
MMKKTNEDGRMVWETNADFWDNYMGDESNAFHRDLVRPNTEMLLDPQSGDFVLDIACGNGNFSHRLVELGARVVAFDYSAKMIQNAKSRWKNSLRNIEFIVCDATDESQLMGLQREKPYDKAVSNMAIMDISSIHSLFKATYRLLSAEGLFVFTTHHPCFTHPEGRYLSSCVHQGEAITGQPVKQYYYHRPLQDILRIAFESGFVMDAFYEVPDTCAEFPIVITVRLRK